MAGKKRRRNVVGVVIAVAVVTLATSLALLNWTAASLNVYTPKIYENFISKEEALHLIAVATPKLEKSEVVSESDKGTEVSGTRTSYQTFLDPGKDPVVQSILTRAAALVQLPESHAEDLQVLRYRKGQQYEPHWDACTDSGSGACRRDNAPSGPRRDTVLLYLNDVEGGGETEFPEIGLKVKPRRGRAVHFENLTPNQKLKHPLSLHAGRPPTNTDEEKWVANLWFRVKPYRR